MDDEKKGRGMGQVIQIDEARINDHLGSGPIKSAFMILLDDVVPVQRETFHE